MATYNFSPIGNESQQFFGAAGANFPPNLPLNGGFLNTFQAGTSTPIATYANNLGSVQNAVSMQLGPDGRFAGAVWLLSGQAYKFQLTDSTGFQIWIIDNVTGINDTGVGVTSEWIASNAVPTYSSATTFTTPGNTTTTFQVGRRVKATVTAGIVYGSVLTSTFGVSTTVVLTMDTGMALDSGLNAVQVALLGESNPSVPSVLPYAMTLSGADTISNQATTYSGLLRIGTNANQPAFHARRSSNQTTGGPIIIFDTINKQNGTGYSNSTGVFTAPVTGWYQINAMVSITNNSGGTLNVGFNLVISSGQTFGPFVPQVTTTNVAAMTASTCVFLTAADTISVNNNSGAGLSANFFIGQTSEFSGFMMF